TPLGNDAETVMGQGQKKVENGVAPLTRLNPDDFPVKIAAEVKGFDVEEYIEKKRSAQNGSLHALCYCRC
ncbi:3-oxoacyl-ACP synthase, partial [Listeria floridensis FSL S10-1187]